MSSWFRTVRAACKRLWPSGWGLRVSIFSVCFGTIFFVARITPLLSDSILFWLKLFSFVITATLGVVGIVTDFKDEQSKKLTRAGKLNLAGLALAAVIGIMAQRAEYNSANKSSEQAKKSLADLNNQNRIVLARIIRER